MSIPWLIGVARHKLADHWRGKARQERLLADVGGDASVDDPWDAQLDALRATEVLERLGAQHRAALTLRYVDGKVPVVSGLKRISKPGLRVYAGKTDIPRVLGGLGIVIVSTSQGIMTGAQARKAQLGGEVLAYVW